VIRDDNELGHTRQYIENTPLNWDSDADNPANML